MLLSIQAQSLTPSVTLTQAHSRIMLFMPSTGGGRVNEGGPGNGRSSPSSSFADGGVVTFLHSYLLVEARMRQGINVTLLVFCSSATTNGELKCMDRMNRWSECIMERGRRIGVG